METRNVAFLFLFALILAIYTFSRQIQFSSFYSPQSNLSPTPPMPNQTQIFCIIKSYLKSYRRNRPQMAHKIWGHKCDDYRILTIMPKEYRTADWKLGDEFEIAEPLKILQPKTATREVHSGITLRIYHALMSIFKRFPNYSWYYLVDDDAYVNVNNMRKFLNTKNSSELVTYGFDFNVFFRAAFLYL